MLDLTARTSRLLRKPAGLALALVLLSLFGPEASAQYGTTVVAGRGLFGRRTTYQVYAPPVQTQVYTRGYAGVTYVQPRVYAPNYVGGAYVRPQVYSRGYGGPVVLPYSRPYSTPGAFGGAGYGGLGGSPYGGFSNSSYGGSIPY